MKNWLVGLLILSALPSYATQSSLPWPEASPASLGIDAQGFKDFEDRAFTDTDLWRTDSIVIIYKGKLAYQRYAHGYSAEMRHISWSMAKSFTAIVFGIAADKNLISGTDRLSDFYGDVASTPEQLARMQNVSMFNELNMDSGRQWVEDYTTTGSLSSTIVQMNYLNGHKDMAAYTAAQPLTDPPGAKFLYSSGSPNVIMGALKKRLGEAYAKFPQDNLFGKIGMTNVVWERDASGTFLGGTNIYATPLDYARFGYLLLNNGSWDGQPIVSKEWIDYVRIVSPALTSGTVVPDKLIRNHLAYGAGFWLNTPVPRFGIPKPFADIPADAYYAHGHEGQLIVVIPSLDLVVVRTAHDNADAMEADARRDINGFLKPLLHALPNYTSDGSPVLPPVQPLPGESFFSKLALLGEFWSVRDLVGALRAKDYCSCRFIVGQTPAYCQAWVRHGIPDFLGHPSEDPATSSVTVNGRRAYKVDDQTGCLLE